MATIFARNNVLLIIHKYKDKFFILMPEKFIFYLQFYI